MRKTTQALFIFGTLVLAGCGTPESGVPPVEPPVLGSITASEAAIPALSQAMKKDVPQLCTYTSAGEPAFSGKVMVLGETFRSHAEKEGIPYVALFDGETYSLWDEQTKTGVQMNRECAQNLDGEPEGDLLAPVPKDETGLTCADIDFVDLSVPDDVTFTDPCEETEEEVSA